MLESEDPAPLPPATIAPYAWYVLGVLFLVYVVSFIDRSILSILAQDIKAGLHLSDAQLGFLYGTAFAVFYSLFGVALGRLADGWYRGRLIALGLALWSGMTVLSGFASSYGQLAAARAGVGIGESSASPAAYSLLADYFPQKKRGLALSIYTSGIFVGNGLSLPLGGWIAHSWSLRFAAGGAPLGLAGWQAAFVAVGLPGLLLALWVFSLREPQRGLADGRPRPVRVPGAWGLFGREIAALLPPLTLWNAARFPGALRSNLLLLAAIAAGTAALVALTGDPLQWCTLGVGLYAAGSWVQTLRNTDPATCELLFGTPSVVLALVGFGLINSVSYTFAFWITPYAIRTFHIGSEVAGLMIGVPAAVASGAGCVLGGRLSDVWKRYDPRGRIYVCMLSIVLPAPFAYAALNARSLTAFYILAPLTLCMGCLYTGSAPAAIQDYVLPRMRGVAAATMILGLALIGLGLGPYCVGKISQLTGSLRFGILSIFVISPLTLYLFWRACRGLPNAEKTKWIRAAAVGDSVPNVEGDVLKQLAQHVTQESFH